MSEYDYDDRRRSRRVRERSPEYVTETTYIQRGNPPSRELVYRPREPEDSIEDIPRDFPPPNAQYRRTTYRDEYAPRRARSAGRRGYYDDDYHDGYGPAAAAAGAAAGAAAYAGRPRNRRRESDYYSDDDYDRHPRRERRKSKVEGVLDDFGLGGVAAAVTKQIRSRSKSRRRRSHSRDDDSSDSDRSTRSRRGDGGRDASKKWQQAAKAAVLAGATEAFRSRKEAGGWTGAKGQRIATAALGAAGIDGFLDKDPEHHSKRHVLEAVAGGLAATRLANGPRDRSASRGGDVSPSGRSRSRSRSVVDRLRSRSRSVLGRGRSQSRGGSDKEGGGGGASNLKKVAALGGVAAAGKAIYDRVRSKSRGGRRSHSASSDDSYVPSRRQRYNRDRGDPDNGSDDEQGGPRGREEERTEDTPKKRDSSASTVSTTDLEQRRKRTRGKELLTAGLATVATIHAAHGVYSSMVASEKRHKLVLEGEMTPQDARKRKSKNMLQDAAAVGIAALSIKSAFGEWKEMNEQREELHELEARRRKRKKERERREREARMNPFGNMMGGGANGLPIMYPVPFPHPQQQQMMQQPTGPVSYQDGNPYGNIPPPPMGAPPPNRY